MVTTTSKQLGIRLGRVLEEVYMLQEEVLFNEERAEII